MSTKKTTYSELIIRGLIDENPVFRLALSLCPAVAVTTSIKNGVMLGLGVLFVQFCSSTTASILKKWINSKIRVPLFILIIACWVTVTDMVLAAYFPAIYAEIGLYVKLIVAFAIIISRLETFAAKNPVVPSAVDGLGMGLGFIFAMIVIGGFRELLGSGTLLGYSILSFKPLLLAILPAGGFLALGLLMAALNWIDLKRGKKLSAGGSHG